MKKVLLEALLVGVAGAALGFAANAISPRGLRLTRNFFPGENANQVAPARIVGVTSTNSALSSGTEGLAARLKAKGLGLVDREKVVELFHDPRYAQNLVVFIDARPDREYLEGHIPGAYQFDHYYPEKFLDKIIPLCANAQLIVVYCGGGDCELSEMAATMLGNELKVPKEKIFVYGGGMTEWKDKGLPIETGERK